MIERNDNAIGAVLVAGGGIAGIQASLDLANSGYKVYLVEKSATIGGKMAQLDKTFPTGDCATCIISPKLVECTRNLNIEIITQAQVEEMTGEPGRFTVKLKQNPRYVDIDKCNSCGDCEKTCPVRVPDDFNRGLSKTTAIHKITAQAVPNAYVIDKRERPPCVSACPMGQNVQAYVALIAAGKFAEAAEIIRRDNPLPLICGYVCHRPCESECQQSRYGDPVSIRALKRFALEVGSPESEAGSAPDEANQKSQITNHKSEGVAIIGSGPAGLAAADWLARRGYAVTIFEAMSVPGGMMRAGIPDFRLPREVLDSQVQAILDLGVELKLNSPIGADLTIDNLLADGYKAVFAAVGAQKSAGLGIEGEDMQGVEPGIEYIKSANLTESNHKSQISNPKSVCVIGAGNAAMDIARTAVRNGARDVTIVYRRTRREMPADPVEVEDAIKEGVKFVFLTNPKRFVGQNGKLTGIECLKMKLSDERDASGRRRPEPVEGSEYVIACDQAIIATGQLPDTGFAAEANLPTNKWGLLTVDPVTLETSKPGVFAGGDVVAGAGTLSEAVAAGRRAAESMDRYLKSEDLAAGRDADSRVWTESQHQQLEYLHRRQNIHRQLPDTRNPTPNTREAAVAEASRCLNCGICCECGECVKACLAKAIVHDDKPSTREIEVGAVILTPGYEEFDARERGEFGFGRYPNVVTNIQFERMLSAGGPYMGHLTRPGDGREPKKIAFIQCVGSRDAANAKPYCSSVCCMAAIKEAVVAESHSPGLETAIFYQDIRAFGKDFDRYYERAKSDGVRFVRSMVSRVVEMPQTGNLRLTYVRPGAAVGVSDAGGSENSSTTGRVVDEEFDLVVLSTGLRPSAEAIKTAKAVGVALSECGFCSTGESTPVQSSREGVFVAGAFQEPKDIPETVTQASAAAAAAMEMLAPARGTMVVHKAYPPERDVIDEVPRIGVFICHCGINIAGVIDVERVVDAANTMPYVAYAENAVYACADNTQQRMKKLIQEHKLNRLLVASCTPRTHEALFRDTARECGLNPFLVEMTNIRDQCSWVHPDEPDAATRKAIDLVRMATARCARLGALTMELLQVDQTALVIGGGPSGMSAALSLANQGYSVHLVEKSERLGGRFPETSELVQDVTNHPLITTYLSCTVSAIKGHVGNFTSTIIGEGPEIPPQERFIRHGVVIIATGGREYVPNEYLYGQDSRVLTQYELERALALRGSVSDCELGSHSNVPSNVISNAVRNLLLTTPEKQISRDARNDVSSPIIAMIQCVGSRSAERPFCSRRCCTDAVKNAIKIKELRPEARVFVLYRDMRTYGSNELYYQKAREMGVIFVKYDPEHPPEVRVAQRSRSHPEPVEGRDGRSETLIMRFTDPDLGREMTIKPDLLVLSTGISPTTDNPVISDLAKVPINADGFLLEAHLKLRPVDFASEGIFLCGSAHSPKSTSENIQQGLAAAGRAATILSKKTMTVGGQVSHVDVRKCVSCLTCVKVCPYGAPEVSPANGKNRVEIEAAKCMGCGSCAAACPAKAIQLGHFVDQQIGAAIDALLEEVLA